MGYKRITDSEQTESFGSVLVNDGGNLRQIEKQKMVEALGIGMINEITFKGADTTENILTIADPKYGDKWFSTDEKAYYLYMMSGWVNVGSGEDYQKIMDEVIQVHNKTDDLSDEVSEINAVLPNKIDGAYADSEGYLYLTSGEDVVVGPLGPFAGATGSGNVNNAILTVANTSGWISNTISDSERCIVSFTWNSVEDGLITGNGSVNIKVNGSSKLSKGIEHGDISIDIRDYLGVGSNVIRITVSDVYGNSKTLSLNVSVVSFSLESSFNDSGFYSDDVTFPYIPTGSTTKTMQFILDGMLIGSAEITVSGRQQNFTIPKQAHGAHRFEVYFTATVNETVVESNHLYYDIIFTETGNETPVIASSFNASGTKQYYSVTIPYIVLTPSSATTDIVLSANGKQVQALTVDRTKHTWTYRADTVGDLVLEIAAGDVKKTFNIPVTKTDINVSAEENDLELYLSSYGRSNAEADPATWEYNDIQATFENFNFVSDGWQSDDDGNQVLRVAGDARLNIPFQIFANDIKSTGKTIEIEISTSEVMNYDSTIMSCISGGKGIVVTPQKATIKSEQKELFIQYKEGEHTRIAFVVEKTANNRMIYVYINGIMSGVVQYPETDDFQQSTPVGITIGSNECTLDIYCIRVYSNDLTRYQILDNWIADTQNGYDMLQRYNHNNIYDEYGQIVITKLPSDLPYLVLEGTSLPQYKGDKKTVSGYYVDPINSNKSFRFDGASIDVQGTSSQYYKRKNYKIKFSNGFVMEESGETLSKYQMRDDSIPVNTFTFKADVASCEGANNVELVRLYNDICPYKTPPQVENGDVRQGIDGFPIVVFWSNGADTTFLGKYNFNNDKSTENVFGFDTGDESWEILNNTSMRSLFKSADFSGTDWMQDFEGRYPDGSTDIEQLARISEWLVSTDQSAATGEALESPVAYDGTEYTTDTAEYRLAKFKAEADNWLEIDDIVFNYVFTELFLMVDSRAKNAFPTRYEGGKWCILPYDYDTAIGTNNEGLLVFDYNLEDIDKVNGSNVYNGQDSVLYINTRMAFQDRIESMYQTLRSNGQLSYEDTERRFRDHQSLWPEAIFNEDSYYKYLAPLIEDGEATYLTMLQGSKESQRKWWLYNRYRYLDSKYTTGDALKNTITLRAYQKSDFSITPYADIYPCVAFDSTKVKTRGKRNEACEITSPATWNPNGSDAVVTVYSADQIKDVGDISPFKIGYGDFSKATKLQKIKVGDLSETYSNENLTELLVGNNTLLKTVDVRNCPNLATTVDLSGCTGLEEAYFEGTAVTGVSLCNGGNLKLLHLPGTVTNLTLRNKGTLTDFIIEDTSKITTLWIENTPSVDILSVLNTMAEGSRIRIVGINLEYEEASEFDAFLDALDKHRGIDVNGNNTINAEVYGNVSLDEISRKALNKITNIYTGLNVTYNSVGKYMYQQYLTGELTSYSDDQIETLGAGAFNGMSNLNEISLPNVSNVGNSAFASCYGLTLIVLHNVTDIGQYAFFRSSSAEEILLPKLQNIKETQAFNGCSKLAKVDLGYATTIQSLTFESCTSLETIILRSNTVVTAWNGSSTTIPDSVSPYIYVPLALVDTYKTNSIFSSRADYIRAIEDYPDICGEV